MAARLRSASWTKSPRARPPGPQKKKFTKIEQTFLLKLGQIKVWKKGWTNGTFRYPNMNILRPG